MHRGRGIAHQIGARAVEIAFDTGASAVELLFDPANLAARRIVARLGARVRSPGHAVVHAAANHQSVAASRERH